MFAGQETIGIAVPIQFGVGQRKTFVEQGCKCKQVSEDISRKQRRVICTKKLSVARFVLKPIAIDGKKQKVHKIHMFLPLK